MNLFSLPDPLPEGEHLEDLLHSPSVRIERIVSQGQRSPRGFWYDQDTDEWVSLLQGFAVLAYPDGRSVRMEAGDHLLIPAHVKHRVARTSKDPPCIWLAVHGNLT